jgi:hypothetical protein
MLGGEAIRHDEPLVELRRQALGAWHLWHSLVLEADGVRAVRRERHGCEHDLAPALIAGHLSLHGAPAVTHAPHAVLDRNLRMAGRQEVDVDRVTRAVLYRARGRGQHLGEQLAAEDPGPEVLDAARFEAIVAERFDVERVEERLERTRHMRARHPSPKRRVRVAPGTLIVSGIAGTEGEREHSWQSTGSTQRASRASILTTSRKQRRRDAQTQKSMKSSLG